MDQTRKSGRLLVYAAAILAASALVARADDVQVNAEFAPADQQLETLPVTITSNYLDGGNPAGTVAGVYQFIDATYTAPAGGVDSGEPVGYWSTNLGTSFTAVCIDFEHSINYGDTGTWQIENLTQVDDNGVGINAHQANAIGFLWNYIATSPPDNAATLQLAVWDIIYNGDDANDNLGSSDYSSAAPPPNVSYAGISTADIDAASAAADLAWADTGDALEEDTPAALVSVDGEQDFSVAIVLPDVVGVPLPASAGVGFSMLAGFGGLALLRKRLSRKDRIA